MVMIMAVTIKVITKGDDENKDNNIDNYNDKKRNKMQYECRNSNTINITIPC